MELHPAMTAMNHWIMGAATGDWTRLIAMLDPAVTFHVPVDGFAGVRHGAADAVRFFDWLTATVRADLVVHATLTGSPAPPSRSGSPAPWPASPSPSACAWSSRPATVS